MSSTNEPRPLARIVRRLRWPLLAAALVFSGMIGVSAPAASAAGDCDRAHVGCVRLTLDDRWRSAWISISEPSRSDCPASTVQTHWKVRYRANANNVDIAYFKVWNMSDTRLSPGWADVETAGVGQFRLKPGVASLSKYKDSKIYGGKDVRVDQIWSKSNIPWGDGQLIASFTFSQSDGHAFCGIGPALILTKR